jgi:integrating conjugative element protein (TIGR03756 family)
VFNQFVSSSGYFCQGAGTAFMPYLLSTLDTPAWRYNVPEMAYPEALIPGMREVGARTTLNLWGNVYPRGGFLHQTDDHKAGAVVAQRAGDVVTRRGQIHVYQPLLANARDGYWPAGALVEGDASTGKWQELTPRPVARPARSSPATASLTQAQQGDYAWALWRPYACCERRGPGVPRQRRFPLEGAAMKRPEPMNPSAKASPPAAPHGASRRARPGLRPRVGAGRLPDQRPRHRR